MQNKLAVFIMSCDKNVDVARYMLGSLVKYWPDINFDIYFGLNKLKEVDGYSGALPLKYISSQPRDWKSETLEQLENITNTDPSLTHLLVILDDFLFTKKVNNALVQSCVESACIHDLPYLSLKRSADGKLQKLFFSPRVAQIPISPKIFQISPEHEYAASLQVAVWRIDYLKSRIAKVDNIWKFEHPINTDLPHYSVYEHILNYIHIVEKGKWNTYTQDVCIEHLGYFDKGSRAQCPPIHWTIKDRIAKWIIDWFGYNFLDRLRKLIPSAN